MVDALKEELDSLILAMKQIPEPNPRYYQVMNSSLVDGFLKKLPVLSWHAREDARSKLKKQKQEKGNLFLFLFSVIYVS